jgi:beta-lactamase class A
MRSFTAFFCFVAAAVAQPALAEAPARYQPLQRHLAAMIASNPGNVGIAALDLRTGELVGVDVDEAFPMASTVKIAVAANYLAQVEAGRRTLDDTIRGRSARSLIDAMMIRSDNNATDILMRDLGGPETLQRWLTQNGVTGLRVDRNIAQLLAAKRDLRDIRDSSTPRAMVTLLQRIDSGALLRPSSRAYLLDVMARCQTGKNRIRGMLPYGTRVEHKTGTLNNYASDVGFITLNDGRRVAVAMFARQGTDRPGTIARAARAIFDGFNYVIRYPFTAAAGSASTYARAAQ